MPERAPKRPARATRFGADAWARIGPVLTVLALVLIVWYAAAVWLNAPQIIERTLAAQPGWGAVDLIRATLSMPRPGRIVDVIESGLPADRTLDIRDTPQFAEIAHRVRVALQDGHGER